jgi:translation initiation factor 5A
MAMDEKKFGQAGSLKPGSYVLIDDEVCQVKSTEKSKPGKHGAAKVRVVAFNIFTGQKKGLLKGTDGEIEIPMIPKATGQIVAVIGDRIQLMDVTSYETLEAPKPADISGLESGVEVEYIRYGSNVKIVRKK